MHFSYGYTEMFLHNNVIPGGGRKWGATVSRAQNVSFAKWRVREVQLVTGRDHAKVLLPFNCALRMAETRNFMMCVFFHSQKRKTQNGQMHSLSCKVTRLAFHYLGFSALCLNIRIMGEKLLDNTMFLRPSVWLGQVAKELLPTRRWVFVPP